MQMELYSRESFDDLREKVDLVEVVSPYVQLKSMGSSYKGLCPFHSEKSPSFVIQKGDSHYHCFGCGAHGDAITFLREHMNMSFTDAVHMLADRFHVSLQKGKKSEERLVEGKTELRKALQCAADFYHYYLLHTKEGHGALDYLYERGLDLEFIRLFKVGFAPRENRLFLLFMRKEKVPDKILEKVGLIKASAHGPKQPFFWNRAIFPIQNGLGQVVGFSGRKMGNQGGGPKYVNSPDTPLFKKSRTLYGLSFSRRRIAKHKKVMIVEGQIDALRLIQEGFDWTVAGQGTAFGKEHIDVLRDLGVSQAYLALDGDQAGQVAAAKIGDLLQREGINVLVVPLPEGMDPDTFLRKKGPLKFEELLSASLDYLPFLLEHLSQGLDVGSPSQKSHLVQTVACQIRQWNHPVMVYESLRRLAKLLRVPEKLVGLEEGVVPPSVFTKMQASLDDTDVQSPELEIETDLLRWLVLIKETEPRPLYIIKENLSARHFRGALHRRFFSFCLEHLKKSKQVDLMELSTQFQSVEEKQLFSKLIEKKINTEKMEEGVIDVVKQLLERHLFAEKERMQMRIESGFCSEAERLQIAKEFNAMRENVPEIQLP